MILKTGVTVFLLCALQAATWQVAYAATSPEPAMRNNAISAELKTSGEFQSLLEAYEASNSRLYDGFGFSVAIDADTRQS